MIGGCAEHEDKVVELVRRARKKESHLILIHDMSGSFWRRAAEVEVPVLASLHLRAASIRQQSFENISPNVSFSCVSESQSRSFRDLYTMLGVVPNGIALENFGPGLADGAEQNPGNAEGCCGWDVSARKKLRTWRWRLPSALACRSRLPGRSILFLITSNILTGKWPRA